MKILSERILNIPGYWITNINAHSEQCYYLSLRKKAQCPVCKSKKLLNKDKKTRKIQHESIALRLTYLFINCHKYQCKHCGKYFWERLPAILPYNRKTEPLRKQVAHHAMRGVTKKDIASDFKIGQATVHRYFLKELKLLSNEILTYECPRILGIDEHFFTKKQGYVTTLCDISQKRIFDLLLGRSEKSLERFFIKLKNRERCKIVCMDLSETYRHLIKRFFPNAKIVSDRFHVIRVINHHFMKQWQNIDPLGRKNRGLLSLMRRHESKLTEEQKQRLRTYFKDHPGLEAIYDFKQEICVLLNSKNKTKKQCRDLIPQFFGIVEQLKTSCFEPMVTLGKTLDSWKEEMTRMWRFSWSNAMTEGFHNKMKMLVRRAYGFRNFENYRLWVKILCR